MTSAPYKPPRVWKWETESGGTWASINRPVAGPTHEKALPEGKHPFQLYSLGTPNGQKVTVLFEELLAAGHQGAEYDAWFVDIAEGDQFSSGFVDVNPNSKIPALLDRTGSTPIRVFESGAILLHLAEKFDAFIPAEGLGRAECLSWLMWQMSTAPVIGGGFGHFYHYAPERYEYPINRYAMETKRILDVADRRLGECHYLAGEEYTIADIAAWCWISRLMNGDAYGDAHIFLDLDSYGNLGRWVAEIGQRKGVRRGSVVNRNAEGFTRERHSAADIDAVLKD